MKRKTTASALENSEEDTKKAKIESKSAYNLVQKNYWISLFCNIFTDGVDEVLNVLEGRFLNPDPEECYDKELKGFFINAAQRFFNGETSADSITIKEVEGLFKTNKALIELQEEFDTEEFEILFQKKYSNSKLLQRFHQLFHKEPDEMKAFIDSRFKNEYPSKNFTILEQKACLELVKLVISGQRGTSMIEREEFEELFTTDLTLLELQETLGITVAGELNTSDEDF